MTERMDVDHIGWAWLGWWADEKIYGSLSLKVVNRFLARINFN